MKRVTELTPHQLETWAAMLGCYETRFVNRAVVEFGMTADPFPDIGKLVERCETYRQSELKGGKNFLEQPKGMVAKIAKALRLEV